jgi:pilus assembly protein CpaB
MAVVLGLVGAILVYVAFSRDGGGSGGGGDLVPIVFAKSDIAARTRITASLVEVKLVEPDKASSLAYSDVSQAVGQVTRFPIAANEQILSTKVVPLEGSSSSVSKSLSYVVPKDHRAIAIEVEEVAFAGGLLLPGDYVDILVVYDISFQSSPTDPTQREEEDAFFAHVLYQNKEVLAVSQNIVDVVVSATGEATVAGAHRQRNSEAKPEPKAATVTLALTPEEALKLYIADQNGRIRLIVRPYGETGERPIDPLIETDLFPRTLPNPFIR